jgi:L-fucose mutarotase
VICDVSLLAATIAAETTCGRLIDMADCDIPTAARAILSLMPLDTCVPAPVNRMQVVGDPDPEMLVFAWMQTVVDAAEGRTVEMPALERFAFYEAAKRSFANLRTADSDLPVRLNLTLYGSRETQEITFQSRVPLVTGGSTDCDRIDFRPVIGKDGDLATVALGSGNLRLRPEDVPNRAQSLQLCFGRGGAARYPKPCAISLVCT